MRLSTGSANEGSIRKRISRLCHIPLVDHYTALHGKRDRSRSVALKFILRSLSHGIFKEERRSFPLWSLHGVHIRSEIKLNGSLKQPRKNKHRHRLTQSQLNVGVVNGQSVLSAKKATKLFLLAVLVLIFFFVACWFDALEQIAVQLGQGGHVFLVSD